MEEPGEYKTAVNSDSMEKTRELGMLKNSAMVLDWIEIVGAQIWPNRNEKRVVVSWTVQVKSIYTGELVQPTRPTLREALNNAIIEYAKNQRV